MKQATYSTSQKALHWVSVILIGIMAFTGLAYVYEWADESIIIGHQIAGQVLGRRAYRLARALAPIQSIQ